MSLSRKNIQNFKPLISAVTMNENFCYSSALSPFRTFCSFQRVSHLLWTLHLIVTFIRHATLPAATHHPLSNWYLCYFRVYLSAFCLLNREGAKDVKVFFVDGGLPLTLGGFFS